MLSRYLPIAKSLAIVLLLLLSMLVSADCAQTCQEQYDECMSASHSVGKEKICSEILYQCKLDCAQ